MRIRVEWLDGEVRVYEHVDSLTAQDGLLMLHRRPYVGGAREWLVSVPLPAVREYRREDA